MKTLYRLLAIVMVFGLVFAALPMKAVQAEAAEVNPALQAGADRLTALQNNDGGWDWPLDNLNPATGSALNTIAPIGMGLAQAYLHTANLNHLDALSDVGALLLTKTEFATSDGYLAAQLDAIFDVTTYTDYVKLKFYDKLESETYLRKGITYSSQSYVTFLRNDRTERSANLAAWDLGIGLVSAASCGVSDTELQYWIDGVKAEINDLDDYNDVPETMWYFSDGLAGALYGLAYVGEDFNPDAGYYAAAEDIGDLFDGLLALQNGSGGFVWHPDFLLENDQNENTQATAYAMLALNESNRAAYLSNIQAAADYLLGIQLPTGGWDNYPAVGTYDASGENNEVTAEALWGIATAYPEVWVCPTGDCGHPGFAFNTIQGAIDAVDIGGMVNVLPGTYAEAITLNKAGITVKSTDGAATTFIDTPSGTLTMGVEALANLGDVTFDGFTVQNFTESGIVQRTSNSTGTSFHVLNNIVIPAGGYLRNGIQVSGNGSTVIGNTVYGAPLTDAWSSSGILVVNASNVLVEFNTIIGGDLGVDIGIGVQAYTVDASNVTIRNNTITDAGNAFRLEGGATARKLSGITIENNSVTGAIRGVNSQWVTLEDIKVEFNQFEEITGEVLRISSTSALGSMDASPNWFGVPTGPTPIQIAGDITYTPWCGDAACSFLNPTTLTGDLQTAIDDAPDNMIIYVPAGTYNQTGGFNLNNDRVTLILGDGVVIQNESPCFYVDADHVRILGESPLGAKCVPTGGAAGIIAYEPINDFVVDGIEIDGTGQSSVAGIQLEGGGSDIQILNNYIHDLSYDGYTTPAILYPLPITGVFDIRGNLFKGTAGIETGEFLTDATYNSWGAYTVDETIANVYCHPDSVYEGSCDATNDYFIDFDPWTHVELFLDSSGTPWTDQVVNGSTITYTVSADLVNITGAEFTLKYDPEKFDVVSTSTTGTVFDPMPVEPVEGGATRPLLTLGTGEIKYAGWKLTPVSGEDQVLFSVTFLAKATGTSDVFIDSATDVFAMSPSSGPSNNVYAAALDSATVNAIALPTISSTDIQGYYLTGETREFTVDLSNLNGATYAHGMFYYRIKNTTLADVAVFQYEESDTPEEDWLDMPMTQDGADVIGYWGPTGGDVLPAEFVGSNLFQIQFANAGEYHFEFWLQDLDANFELASFDSTAYVYNTPVITETGLTGDHQGLTVPFTLNIDNMSAMDDPYNTDPITFLVDLDLKADVTLTYPGGSVTCTVVDGCPVFPVTLAAGENDVLLSALFTGTTTVASVPVTLYDSLADPDRPLATATFGQVAVYDNVAAVLGTVSMQGRTARAGVPVTLTAVTVPYGPYTAVSIEQISNNLSFANLAEGVYTVTTNQPRYLNVTAGLLKTINIATKTSLNSLELKGGNAVWSDNIINIQDAAKVGSEFGSLGITYDSDVNFDGKVNVQDLALVGGNYLKESGMVYSTWTP